MLQCYICDKEFENLVSHNNFDSTTVTVHENNKEIFSPPKITVEIIPNVGFEVKYFSNQISLHHDSQNILCDLCNKTFSASEYLEIHIRKFHTV